MEVDLAFRRLFIALQLLDEFGQCQAYFHLNLSPSDILWDILDFIKRFAPSAFPRVQIYNGNKVVIVCS